MDQFTSLYAPPPYINNEGKVLLQNEELVSYVNDKVDKSMNFLRSNRGWKSADICMAIFYGDETDKVPVGLSKVSVKKLRRQAREAVANASNIRPRWKHKSNKDKYPQQAKMYDDLRDDWFYQQFVDEKIKSALQYAAGAGTGYIWLWPDIDPSTGELEIIPNVLSWRQFLPHYASVDATIDSLYGYTIHLEMPVPDAHRKFPNHINIIKPDRNVPSYFSKGWRRIYRAWKGVADRMAQNNKVSVNQGEYPTADIFFTFINDDSINTTGKPIFIGKPGAHYSYIVPSLYSEDGELNADVSREDCKLFPYKRLIISTKHGVIWDGPPLWINRFASVIPFYFEKVIGEFLGISIIRDGRRLEESANQILRSFEDAINGRLSPPVGIDTNVPKDIRAQLSRNVRALTGKVFHYNVNTLQTPIKPLMPADYYNIDGRGVDIIKFLFEMQDYQMGTNDLSNLARLNQMPAADTQEHFLEALGALATDHSRGIERSLIQMAKVWLDFAPQVYTTERVIIKLGINKVIDAVDFDPNSLVPDPNDYKDCVGENAYAARLQKHMRNFSIYAAPNSLMDRMSQTNKLVLMTLIKMGVHISTKRLYESFIDDGQHDIENQEWYKEQLETIKITASLQKALATANAEADPQNQLASQLLEKLKGTNGEGRPPTNANPPRLTEKTDNNGAPRSTVETN